MKYISLLVEPITIKLSGDSQPLIIPPSGMKVSIKYEEKLSYILPDGIPVHHRRISHLVGMPEIEDETLYICSGRLIHAIRALHPELLPYVVSPDVFKGAYKHEGQVFAITGFVTGLEW